MSSGAAATSARAATPPPQGQHAADPNDHFPCVTPKPIPSDNPSSLSQRQREAEHAGQPPIIARSGSGLRGSSFSHPLRKPSPGLAARLKALGLLGSGDSSSPPRTVSNGPSEIGRLPEDTLRQLDQSHQANSANDKLIERRGRPWKGAGVALQFDPPRSRPKESSKLGTDVIVQTATTAPPIDAQPELAPKIPPTPTTPLEMDNTKKHGLLGQANGDDSKFLSGEQIKQDVPAHTQDQENERPPPPLPKDTPPTGTNSTEFTPDAVSYFNPLGLQRTGSIYTISRLSFATQLAQLTSLQLPDAESLSGRIAAIPTAQAAATALINAAEQTRMWIYKASEVIDGLDSDDDVEWAAAGGREGYEDVEASISRFEELINIYVGAIEALQGRSDIASVSGEDLQHAVTQMESILGEWAKIRKTLTTAKRQVETAMEWEELWNMVLGDIQNEMDELSRLIFEMEERRHRSLMAISSEDGVDIGDLETIVEETPPAVARNTRFRVPLLPVGPTSPESPPLTQDDSGLLALFARMQPLRASLDFLPMRLSVFQARAESTFPTACEELAERRATLESEYQKLEKDAESLRKELGEDKWVLVFRGAGRQAQKMYESVERSMAKLREAVDSGLHLSDPAAMSKKIESYDAKKTHYGPAVERVLSIIDRGVKDRLTVNGEILRLHTDMRSKWDDIKEQLRETDVVLEEMQVEKGQTLRDSVSSMLSNDRSTASGHETPSTSPPSSVVMAGLGISEPRTPSAGQPKSRSSSVGSSSRPAKATPPRRSGLVPPSKINRKALPSRLSNLSTASSILSLSTPPRSGRGTPSSHRLASSSKPADGRPRWNGSVRPKDSDLGHNFKPLSLTTPSPYAKTTPPRARPERSVSALTPASLPRASNLPLRSSMGRATSATPTPKTSMTSIKPPSLASSSPAPHAQRLMAKHRLTSKVSMGDLSNRRASVHVPRLEEMAAEAGKRPASSQASRRTSLLPLARARNMSSGSMGRAASPAVPPRSTTPTKTSVGGSDDRDGRDHKPRWHF